MKGLKRGVLPLLLLFSIVFASRADALGDFAASRAVNAPKAAVMVTDLATGRTMASHNADLPLIPASVMKSVTIATLLDRVGHDYVYRTPVHLEGRLHEGRLEGNLVVTASGDPSLNSANFRESPDFIREITEALRLKGVRTVTGEIRIDETSFPGPAVNPTWASGDLPHAYGTGTHGFNFEDNASGKKSVADPAARFKTRLESAMGASGITIENKDVDTGHSQCRLLCRHQSPEIDEIMRSCMMRSDNQFAEALLRLVGLEYGKEGSTTRGAAEMTKYWTRHHAPMQGVTIVDGSGLSRSNRITAQFMTAVLKRMHADPYYASFFPLAGQEGTLRRFLAGTPLQGYVALKTGSMNGIQCYAGYKLDDDYHPTHTIVVIMNEMSDRASARLEVERLLLALFTGKSLES